MSGGTLIALAAADEIVMSEYAVLGPVDPQLGQSGCIHPQSGGQEACRERQG
jgi:ClpP class serine protease